MFPSLFKNIPARLLPLGFILISACSSGGNETSSSPPSSTSSPNSSSGGIEWLHYKGQDVAITNDVDNCLDRDYDNHRSRFCGGDDLNDMNSSVNPSEPEICGDGFDNNQDGLMDYADTVSCQHAAAPKTYHVNSATGDPVNGTGSEASPFATITQANAVVASGDTVLLFEGDYGDVQLAFTSNPYDTVDALENRPPLYTDWVTYKAAPGAEHLARLGRLEIGNRITPSGYNDKYPKDSEYAISGPLNPTLRDFRIRIEGLTIGDGVSIQHGRFVHLKNNIVNRIGPIASATDCTVYFNNTGIEIGGRYIIIEDNEVTHTAHGIHGGAHDVVIRNNRIHHVTHDGLGLILGRNYLIEGNQIYNTDDGYNDNVGTTCNIHSDGFQPYIITYEAGANMGYDIRNVSFKRNLIYHTESMIIMLQSSPYADYSNWMSEIKLRNFLFENNIFGPSGGFMLNIIADGFDGFIFRNNSLLRIEGDSYVSDQGRTLLSNSFSVRLSGPASVKSAIYNNIIPEFIELSDTLDFAGYNYYDTPFLNWYSDLEWYLDWVGDLFREGTEAPYIMSDFSGNLIDYSSPINTGTRIDGNGIPLDLPITEDFYGNPRDNRPDRGAVEVTGLNPDHQLSQ